MKGENRWLYLVLILFVVVMIYMYIPKEETYVCAFCEENVTQVPNTKLEGLYQLYVEYHDKICDECYELISDDIESRGGH